MQLLQTTNKYGFEDHFQNCLDDVESDEIRNIFILGDLNSDFATSSGRKLYHLCQMQNMEGLFRQPTRITDVSATILDQIITNPHNLVYDLRVTPPFSTNVHGSVSVCLNFNIKKEAMECLEL